MMKKMVTVVVTAVIVMGLGFSSARAQSVAGAKQAASAAPKVSMDEVKTPEALLAAIYAAISGPAGERDWDHFRGLFLPEARLTATRERPEGVTVASMSVDDYAKRAGDYFKKEGFYESGVVNRVFQYGRMVAVLSGYESRHAPGEKPFARGINSMQMISDGKRWWVVSIAWDDERASNPMPAEFTK